MGGGRERRERKEKKKESEQANALCDGGEDEIIDSAVKIIERKRASRCLPGRRAIQSRGTPASNRDNGTRHEPSTSSTATVYPVRGGSLSLCYWSFDRRACFVVDFCVFVLRRAGNQRTFGSYFGNFDCTMYSSPRGNLGHLEKNFLLIFEATSFNSSSFSRRSRVFSMNFRSSRENFVMWKLKWYESREVYRKLSEVRKYNSREMYLSVENCRNL